jgi:hypothetical protein
MAEMHRQELDGLGRPLADASGSEDSAIPEFLTAGRSRVPPMGDDRVQHLMTLALETDRTADRLFSEGKYTEAEQFTKLAASYRSMAAEAEQRNPSA